MPIVLRSVTDRVRHSLSLQTIKKSNIDNEQFFEIEELELKGCEILEKSQPTKYPFCTFKGSSTPLYNCHGMTFASRRTGVYEDAEIEKILREDNYLPVREEDVMIGDIVIYRESGEITHSGIVIFFEKNPISPKLPIIKVWSKWKFFKEVIHPLNECPYSQCTKHFYRLTHAFEIKPRQSN